MGAARVLVIGFGQTLRSDDGIGLQVVRTLRASHATAVGRGVEVEWIEAGGSVLAYTESLAGCAGLIAVDAVDGAMAPGCVQVFEGEDMDRVLRRDRALSTHAAGLAELLALARTLGVLPPRRALVAVQLATLAWGETPSQAVSAALPQAAACVVAQLQRWGYYGQSIPPQS
jgi:hydrogenase maturation protease